MRKHGDYIPTKKTQLDKWLENFTKKAEEYKDKYSISSRDIEMLKPISESYSKDMIAEMELLNKKLAQFKKTAADRKKAIKISRSIAQRIKNDFDYTEGIGRIFDIIGPEHVFNHKAFSPKLKLRRVSEGVEISFNKSQTDGVNIYRKLEGPSDFQFLNHDTHSPYIDTKDMDKHATYEYMAWAVIKDEEIGIESHISIITV